MLILSRAKPERFLGIFLRLRNTIAILRERTLTSSYPLPSLYYSELQEADGQLLLNIFLKLKAIIY